MIDYVKELNTHTFLPGDIVRSRKTGSILVIKDAETLIGGKGVNWRYELPRKTKHGFAASEQGWETAYVAQSLPGEKNEKHAWWGLNELELLKAGPLHKYMDKDD